MNLLHIIRRATSKLTSTSMAAGRRITVRHNDRHDSFVRFNFFIKFTIRTYNSHQYNTRWRQHSRRQTRHHHRRRAARIHERRLILLRLHRRNGARFTALNRYRAATPDNFTITTTPFRRRHSGTTLSRRRARNRTRSRRTITNGRLRISRRTSASRGRPRRCITRQTSINLSLVPVVTLTRRRTNRGHTRNQKRSRRIHRPHNRRRSSRHRRRGRLNKTQNYSFLGRTQRRPTANRRRASGR